MTKMKTKKMAMTTAPMMTTASTRTGSRKFAELRAQYVVTRDTIKAKGRSHAAAQEEILKLSEVFKQFRTVPKQFDYGQQHARHDGPRSYARTSDHEALR